MITIEHNEDDEQNLHDLFNILEREIDAVHMNIYRPNNDYDENDNSIPREVHVNVNDNAGRKIEMEMDILELQDAVRRVEESNAELTHEIDHLKVEMHANINAATCACTSTNNRLQRQKQHMLILEEKVHALEKDIQNAKSSQATHSHGSSLWMGFVRVCLSEASTSWLGINSYKRPMILLYSIVMAAFAFGGWFAVSTNPLLFMYMSIRNTNYTMSFTRQSFVAMSSASKNYSADLLNKRVINASIEKFSNKTTTGSSSGGSDFNHTRRTTRSMSSHENDPEARSIYHTIQNPRKFIDTCTLGEYGLGKPNPNENDIEQEHSLDNTPIDMGTSTSMSISHETNNNGKGSTRTGRYQSNDDSGLIKFVRYSSTVKSWLHLLRNDDIGVGGDDTRRKFTSRSSMALNSGGTRVALIGHSSQQVHRARVFDFDMRSGTWSQVGQTIEGRTYMKVDMTLDGKRIAIASPSDDHGRHRTGQIRVYELHSSSVEQKWVQIGNDGIYGRNEYEYIGFYNLQISSSDGCSRVVFSAGDSSREAVTRVYNYSSGKMNAWDQVGQDIASPYSISSSISGDGSRIAISFGASISKRVSSYVQVYDFDFDTNKWLGAHDPIIIDESDYGHIGYCITMSSDGNILVIGSNSQKCHRSLDEKQRHWYTNVIRGSAELYIYNSSERSFQRIVPKRSSSGNDSRSWDEMDLQRTLDSSITFELQLLSRHSGEDLLSISGYDVNENYNFAKVYEL